jgi:hypothetical protein
MITLIFMLFGGLFVNLDSIPIFLRWIQWISLITYTYKALVQNEFDASSTFSTIRGSISGSSVVESYGLGSPTMQQCIFINLGLAFLYLIAGIIIFQRTSAPLMRLK